MANADGVRKRLPGTFEMLLGEGWETSGDGIYRRVKHGEPPDESLERELGEGVTQRGLTDGGPSMRPAEHGAR